jgi:hypothetical protein
MLSRLAAAAALVLCVVSLSACGGDDVGDGTSAYACPPPIFYGSVMFPRPVDDTFVVGEALGKGDVEACKGPDADQYTSGFTTVYRVPGVQPENGFAATLDGQRYYFTRNTSKTSRACQRQGVICS